jgi:single-strand DNA-binding protein
VVLFVGVSAQVYIFRGENNSLSPGGIVSRSLNKVTLIGNLGADPEIRSTPGGNRVATFSLATSRSWNDPSGNKQEKTEWHRCVVWNSKVSQLADIVEKDVHKGD